MRTKISTLALLCFFVSQPAFAQNGEIEKKAVHAHEAQIFHSVILETDYGAGRNGPVSSWGVEGWIGGDYNKFAFKSEGEREDGHTEQAEFWVMYSRNISDFWDLQAGMRHDTRPHSTTYFVFGTEGLAPQFFETEAHMFLSERGDVTARLHQENEFLLTQRTILQPYLEVNLSAQDIEEQEIGAGLVDGEVGLQTRYEITRKFAPYVDVRYERKFGETASIGKDNGEVRDNVIGALGIRFMF